MIVGGALRLYLRAAVARRLTAPARCLRARSLALVAYGEIGSSLIFALGIVALYAAGPDALGAARGRRSWSWWSRSPTPRASSAMPEAGRRRHLRAARLQRSRSASSPAGCSSSTTSSSSRSRRSSCRTTWARPSGGTSWPSGPWDAIVGDRRHRLARGAPRRVRAGAPLHGRRRHRPAIALVAQLLLAILGFALVFSSDSLRVGIDLGTAPSWGSIALALSLATLAYTGLETVTNFAAEVARAGPHAAAEPVRGDRRRRGGQRRGRRWSGSRPTPRRPTRARPDGVASGLGDDWLQAPLVGIATGIGDELPDGVATAPGGLRRRLSAALVLVTVDRHRHGRRRAAGVLDGPLRHAAPRLRPPRARRRRRRRRPPSPPP